MPTQELERVRDVQVLTLEFPKEEWAALTPRQRVLAALLTQAAKAGRTIAWDQASRWAMPIWGMLKALLGLESLDAGERASLLEYAKLFFIHNGPYHDVTHQKLPFVVSGDLLGTMHVLEGSTTIPEGIVRFLCDPSFEPSNCDKSDGGDIVARSASNYYARGLTFAEVEKWAKLGGERHPLNSHVSIGADGTCEERVWRTRAPGEYSQELQRMIALLNSARMYAEHGDQHAALYALVKFFESGNGNDCLTADIAWVQSDSVVDFILGFIETYLDPREKKGRFEGIVHVVDQSESRRLAVIGENAAYFEGRMPWDDKYRKPNPQPLPYRVVNALFACGDSGPMMPIGVNLPNDKVVAAHHGTKSVALGNVIRARQGVEGMRLAEEFSATPEEVKRAKRWGMLALELLVAMHEVLGHAAGIGPEKGKEILGCGHALEEARADLAALWLVTDPKLREIGVVSEDNWEEVMRAMYDAYARDPLIQLRKVPDATLEEDHMRNRQLVVHWIMADSGAITRVQKGEKTYYCVRDYAAMHASVGKLLAEIMRIRIKGDLDAARNLVETYGVQVDVVLRDEVKARVAALGLSTYTAFVMPEPQIVRGADGVPVDAALWYPPTLEAQMWG